MESRVREEFNELRDNWVQVGVNSYRRGRGHCRWIEDASDVDDKLVDCGVSEAFYAQRNRRRSSRDGEFAFG